MARERPLRIIWAWLGWWRIRHAALFRVNRVWTPVMGVISGVLVCVAPRTLNIAAASGVVQLCNGLLQILTGFFVASLAAVATFNRPSLDDLMGGIAPTLVDYGKRDLERLTRRRFLTMLFGYLSGASIVLYIFGSFGVVAAPLLRDVASGWRESARITFCAVYGAGFSNLILTAFVGLYFLIDRMHKDTPPSGFLSMPNPDDPSEPN